MAKDISLSGKEIKDLIIKGFIQDLKEVKIGTFPLFIVATTKHCIVNPDISLQDVNGFILNKGGAKVQDFVEFLTEMYATGTSRLIKTYLPYPINEKVKMLPL